MIRPGKLTLALGTAVLAVLMLFFVVREMTREKIPATDFALTVDKAYSVENQQLGSLYVIEGAVTNHLASSRCRIQIKATLLDGDGREVAQEKVEAGLTVSISELKFLGGEELQAKLTPSGQDSCRTAEVGPGGSEAFMAIFRMLPPKAVSYKLVVTDSQTPQPK